MRVPVASANEECLERRIGFPHSELWTVGVEECSYSTGVPPDPPSVTC